VPDGDVIDPPAARSPLAESPDEQLPGLDDIENGSWRYFEDSATRITEILHRRLLSEHNLALFDVLLLKLLASSFDGSARMGDLADALASIPSRITQQAARLEARGLLSRSVSARDRRVVLATITRTGRARLEPALRTYARIVRTHYLNPLSRQQMAALGDSCRRISDGLVQHERRPRTPPS
jgi:DNA-binding MarR family transcriptional regulator